MKSKTLHRIQFISSNAIRQVLVSVFSMAIPFIVIHFSSKSIWGSFVSPLLFSLLALQVINWGNKEYLLRHFSMEPGKIMSQYSRNLFTRLPLVFIFSGIAFFCFPPVFGGWVFIWLLGRFAIHSAEALIIYEKKFRASIAIELAGFLLFCGAFAILKNDLTVLLVLILYSAYQFIKGIAYLLLFRNFLDFGSLKFDFTYYLMALPFFLLSILGFLASKVDVYLIENIGDKIVTSDYQIINSLLVFTMSLSAFIYAPFTKNIYRNNAAVVKKTKQLLVLSGLVIVPVSLLIIAAILHFYLRLEFSAAFYIIALGYVFPSFVYGIEIVNLFRQKKEKTVVLILFLGAAANTVLSAAFLYFGHGIYGALGGAAIAQIFVLFLFKLNSHFEKQNHPI
ncbi:MAG TPA: hypothetical protein VK528_10350 [Flavobacterium sp.]|nr:hypothetical protein [Flavobacterium sp.]